MNTNILEFIINDNEKVIIPLDKSDDIIDYSYIAQAQLIIHNQITIIGSGAMGMQIIQLKRLLEKVIIHQLPLHQSIKKSIGYYYNQDLNEENPDIFLISGKENNYWIGSQYLLWTTDSNIKNQQYATWLYNDSKNNIIFEVTPIYPEDYVDLENTTEVQAYKKWMKLYKSFFTCIIPNKIALQWLNQANTILKIIDKNVRMLKKEYETEM
ncbi:MAG: hypothetical protein ACXWL2_04820 [Candidatus Chromulinivorax sp.]